MLGSSALAALRGQLATMVWQCRLPPSGETAALSSGDGDSGGGGGMAPTVAAIVFEMDRRQVRDMIRQLEECAAEMDRRVKVAEAENCENSGKVGAVQTF